MKIILQALLATYFGLSLNATTVSYNTTGAFTGGTVSGSTDFITFSDMSGDTVTITFDFDTSDSATSTGGATNASFGTFVTTVTGSGIDIPMTMFVLTVNQTSPGTAGSTNNSPVTVDGNLTAGSVGPTSSTVNVIFSPTTALVTDTATPGTATYTMFETPLVPPSTGGGDSSLSGTLTYDATDNMPEPATLAMMGAGLLAAGLVKRRRKHD